MIKEVKIEYLGDDEVDGTRLYRLDTVTETYSWIDMKTVMKILSKKENENE